MLHNSLYRRDELLAMNKHPLVLRRRDVHRNVGRRVRALTPAAGQVLLGGEWQVMTGRGGKAESLVAADARDFLGRMGVAIKEGAEKKVLVEIGSCDDGFRAVVEGGRVEVHADSARSLWAGWVFLEGQMRAAGGPVLPAGEVVRRPAWEVQIAPPTWGANYAVPDLSPEFLGDDTFRSLAHAGADGLFVYGDWVLYAKDSPLDELNHPDAEKHLAVLKDAAARATGYGVKLYFVLVSPKLPADHAVFRRHPGTRGALLKHEPNSSVPPIHCLCSSDPDSLAFHAAVVGGLFKEVPDLGGIVCIIGGESYYHCFMRAAGAAIGETNCPHCKGKAAENVIADLLHVTAKAARKHNPAARVMAWPYSAQYFWSKDRDNSAFVDHLPEGVALLTEIDKEQVLKKDGYEKLCWDYSVECDSASDRIVNQALRCSRNGRDLYVKTETAHGIELLHLPYVPAITRSARRWQAIRTLRPAGVLQRWGFVGMFDSAAERIGYLARWDQAYAPDAAALSVARQLVGDLAPQLAAGWRQFDMAVGHLPTLISGGYYIGPLFLGPCCPLPVWTGATPDAFLGNLFYLAELEATGDNRRQKVKDDFTIRNLAQLGAPAIAIQEREYAAARDLSAGGYEMLAKLDSEQLDAVTREELAEQLAIGEYLYRTLRTCANLVRFLRLRDASSPKSDLDAIVRDELENTLTAKSLYERAPWLNHSLRLDVGAPDSLGMVREKTRLLENYLKT